MLYDASECMNNNMVAYIKVIDEEYPDHIVEYFGVDVVGAGDMSNHYIAFIDEREFGNGVVFVPHSRVVEIVFYDDEAED